MPMLLGQDQCISVFQARQKYSSLFRATTVRQHESKIFLDPRRPQSMVHSISTMLGCLCQCKYFHASIVSSTGKSIVFVVVCHQKRCRHMKSGSCFSLNKSFHLFSTLLIRPICDVTSSLAERAKLHVGTDTAESIHMKADQTSTASFSRDVDQVSKVSIGLL